MASREEAMYAQQMYAQQRGGYGGGYGGYGKGNKFNISIAKTPVINGYDIPLDEIRKTSQYQQLRADTGKLRLNKQKELASKYRVAEKHQDILNARNEQLKSVYDKIEASGNYGNAVDEITQEAANYANDRELQEAVKARAMMDKKFQGYQTADGIREEDIKLLEADYIRNMPDIKEDDNGFLKQYQYEGVDLSPFLDPTEEVRKGLATFLKPDGDGTYSFNPSAVDVENSDLGMFLKQKTSKSNYKNEKELNADIYDYVRLSPKHIKMFEERRKIGGTETIEEWAQNIADSTAGLASYYNNSESGSVSLAGAKSNNGGSSGTKPPPVVVEDPVSSPGDGVTNYADTGQNTSQYVAAMDKYTSQAKPFLVNGLKLAGLTQDAIDINLKKGNSLGSLFNGAIKGYNAKLGTIDASVAKLNKQLETEQDPAKVKAITDKLNALNKQLIPMGGTNYSYGVLKDEQQQLVKLKQQYSAGKQRVTDAAVNFKQDYGYGNKTSDGEVDPFNPINTTKFNKDLQSSINSNIANGKYDYEELSLADADAELIEARATLDKFRITGTSTYSVSGNWGLFASDLDTYYSAMVTKRYTEYNAIKDKYSPAQLAMEFDKGSLLATSLNIEGQYTTAGVVDEIESLDKSDKQALLLFLALATSDGELDTVTGTEYASGLVGRYAKSTKLNDDNLEESWTTTTTTESNTNSLYQPELKVVNKAISELNANVQEDFVKQAIGYTQGILIPDDSDIRTALGMPEDYVQDPSKSTYSVFNNTNTIQKKQLHNAGYGLDYENGALTTIPNYGGAMFFRVPIIQKAQASDAAGDKSVTVNVDGVVSNAYFPVGKASKGLYNETSEAYANSKQARVFSWYMDGKVNSSQSTRFDPKDDLDYSKITVGGVHPTKMRINYRTHKVYYLNPNGSTTVSTLAEEWDKILNAYKH